MAGHKTGSLTPRAKGELVANDGTRSVRVPPPTVNGHVLTADSAEESGMRWAAGGGGGPASRTTVDFTTGSLADGAAEVGTVPIAKSFLIIQVEVSAAARVELYSSTAARDADAGRAIGVNPPVGTPHGVIGDWYLDGSESAPLLFVASPEVMGANSTNDLDIAYRVTNKSGGSAAITVTLTVVPEES